MFKWNRVLVALIGVPLLLFIYAGESFFRINLYGLPMLIFTNLVISMGTYEFYKMVKISGKEVYGKFGIIVAIIIPNLVYLSNRSSYLEQKLIAVVLIVATIFMLTYRVFRNQIKGTLEKVSFTLLGIVYVSVFFSQIINLYFLGLISVKPFLKNFLPIATPTIPADVSDTQTKTCKINGNIIPKK